MSATAVDQIKLVSESIWTKVQEHKISACVVATAVSFLTLRSIYCRIRRKLNNSPPGPIGLPLVGNLFSAIDIPKYSAYLASNYGSVTMIYVGAQAFVFLHSIDSINEVFNNKNALDRDSQTSLQLTEVKQHEFHLAHVGEEYWAKKRRNFQTVLIARVDSNFLNAVHNKSLHSHVFQVIDDCIAKKQLWRMSNDINYIQFHAMWNACFGTFLKYESPERKETIDYVIRIFDEWGLDVLLRYLQLHHILPSFLLQRIFPTYGRFMRFLEQNVYKQLNYDESVFDMTDDTWNEHFESVRKDVNACATSKMLAVHRENPDIDSTKYSILGSLGVLYFGGIDTSIHNTEYGLVLLAKFPAVQQKVYNELHAIFGNDVRMDHTPINTVLYKLHYLRAFVHEVLRISSIAGVGVPHYNRKKEIRVQSARDPSGKRYECVIPKKTVIISDIQYANRSDTYWVQKCNGNPMEVCLYAWLDENNKFKKRINRDKLVAFSAGKRNCPGIALALRSSYVLFTKFLLKYEFQLQDSDANVEIKQNFEFTMVMKPKIDLKVIHRHPIQFIQN